MPKQGKNFLLARRSRGLLDKQRLLAITKSDLLDEELQEAIAADLPDIPSIFISSVSGYHIRQLKDMLWEALQRDNQ